MSDPTEGLTPVALLKADIDRVDGVSGPANGVPFLVMKAMADNPDAADIVKAAMEVADGDVSVNATPAGVDAADLPPTAPDGVSLPESPAVDAPVVDVPVAPEVVVAPADAVAPLPPLSQEVGVEPVAEAPAEDASVDAPVEPVDAAEVVADLPVPPAAPEVPADAPAAPEADVVAEAPAAPAADAAPPVEGDGLTAPAAGDSVAKATDPTPVVKDDVADALAAALPEVPVAPEAGDKAWEAADAENAKAAIALLIALRERVAVAAAREGAEGDWNAEWSLEDAGSALDFVLSVLAVHAVNETAEAGETVLKALEARMTEPTTDAPVAEDTDVAKSDAPQTPVSPEGGALLSEDVVKAITGSPAFTDVLKSIVAETVTQTLAAEVAPLRDDVAKALESVAKMEKQPMPGGPLLRGRATTPDGMFYVSKSGVEDPQIDPTQTEDIAKALAAITDPAQRDVAGRAIAAAMHPLQRQQ